ncbi:hypothetical protein GCM10029992_16040 [Glycomyces albus]
MWHYYDGPGWGWAWGLLTFLFWAAIIGLIVWSVLRLGRGTGAAGPVQIARPPIRSTPAPGDPRPALRGR